MHHDARAAAVSRARNSGRDAREAATRVAASRDGETHAGQGRAVRDLLRQLQRARHRPRSARRSSSTTGSRYVLVEKEACCGMPKLELGDLEAVAQLKEKQHSARSRSSRDEGYAILTAGALLHADVQAGAAADVSRGRGRAGGARRDVRSVRVPDAAPPGRAAEDGFQAAARQGVATTCPATCACRTSA